MHVLVVKYERLENLGNFNHHKTGVEVALEKGESPGEALKRAKDFVDKALKPPPSAGLIERANEIVAHPDDHTPKQVREAQTVLEHVNSQGVVEF